MVMVVPSGAEHLLLRPVLGADGGLQPGREVAQDHGGHKQQAAEHAGQGQECAAPVVRGRRATVVDVLGHDNRILDVLLELSEVGRVRRRLLLGVRQRHRLRAVVAVRVPLAPAPVPGRLEQVQTIFLRKRRMKHVHGQARVRLGRYDGQWVEAGAKCIRAPFPLLLLLFKPDPV